MTPRAFVHARVARCVRAACIITPVLLAACSRTPAPRLPGPPAPDVYEEGTASWYGAAFDGRTTASGETFDSGALTAAHPCLPFGTHVRVVNLDNGRDVIVRINDRGPGVRGRVIDVSRAAADALGMRRAGIARVHLILVDGKPPDCP